MKQRVRKLIEYTWADALGYAVIGTPNRLEYDQGFFVKGGDGLADIKPIARLYKTQVYALARHLGLPAAIAERDPTTETFSLPQTQEEFYFGHPYDRMDLLVHGVEEGIARRRSRAARRHGRRGRRERLRRGACACARRRRTCTRARASSTSTARATRPAADVCGIAGILHADSARAGRRADAPPHGAARSGTAAPTATASRPAAAPGSSRRGSRSSTSRPAGSPCRAPTATP